MARKIQVMLHDDLDGGTADETISFSLDGIGYEIDLSKRNAAALRAAMSRYIKAARATRKAGRPAAGALLGPVPRVPARIAVSAKPGTSSRAISTVGRPKSAGRPKAAASMAGVNPAAVRQWAKSKGIAVSERGRLSAQIVGKYMASQR